MAPLTGLRSGARDLGLEGEDLQKRSPQLDLARLIDASHRAGLLPTSFTCGVARREAFFAAQGEAESMFQPVRQEIKHIVRGWQMPDYLCWKTWKTGIIRFVQWLHMPIFQMASPRVFLAWAPFCAFFVALLASGFRKTGAAIGSLLVLVPAALFARNTMRSHPLFYFHSDYVGWRAGVICATVALACLSLAFALWGTRIAARKPRRRLSVSACTLGLGAVLLLWRFGWGPFSGRLWQRSELMDWFFDETALYDRLLWYATPDWLYPGSVVAGVALIWTGLLTSKYSRRLRPGRTRRRDDVAK